MSERLLSLDGSGREFIREGTRAHLLFPRQACRPRGAPRPDGPLLGALPAIDDSSSQVYEIRGGERERTSRSHHARGRAASARRYRYGYRLWIDEQTSMPLKTQLCNQSGEVIEQIVFSTIDLPAAHPRFHVPAARSMRRNIAGSALIAMRAGSRTALGKP